MLRQSATTNIFSDHAVLQEDQISSHSLNDLSSVQPPLPPAAADQPNPKNGGSPLPSQAITTPSLEPRAHTGVKKANVKRGPFGQLRSRYLVSGLRIQGDQRDQRSSAYMVGASIEEDSIEGFG
ncbi:MAG: hypothetical protein Q9219_005606 [cf. Caloplaca sp. 3 TL-2023]